MNKFFYAKIAISNLKKNAKLYLPYLIASIGMISVFYIMISISMDGGLEHMLGGETVAAILQLGSIVIGIFSAIFLFYTNSFLMKQRKKEFGLFNILGMEKRHISKIILCETIFTSLLTIIIGLISGIIFYKLVAFLLVKLTKMPVPFGFRIFPNCIFISILLFGTIFFVTLLFNLTQIHLANPIELLKSHNHGEKEPKTRWLITILGLIQLIAAYYIALTTINPIQALILFFVAVVLVMGGTYFLFTSGSIALLKMLRKNKTYYYKTKHFTAVSGMIYRMKQNAVGLSNICILSTVVLVMISATICLYFGSEESIRAQYPAEIQTVFNEVSETERAHIFSLVQEKVQQDNLKITQMSDYYFLSVTAIKTENNFEFKQSTMNFSTAKLDKISELNFITAADYSNISGNATTLANDTVLLFTNSGSSDIKQMIIGNKTYQVQSYINKKSLPDTLTVNNPATPDAYTVVLPNATELTSIYTMQKEVFKENSSVIQYIINLDISGRKEDLLAAAKSIQSLEPQFGKQYVDTASRSENKDIYYNLYGSFLFLGIFLGIVFLIATVLIIYYKQISEGYDDKDRFHIMQKVGMSAAEVRSSIKSQIVSVFFLPLLTAGLHVLMAFPMLKRMLALFGLNNDNLFLICTVATIIIFALIYLLVYSITAISYYKIVKS
jgi:putative ABC transport system permease protein